MKCTNCGKEFEGKFCPECATPADPSVSQSAAQIPTENVCPKCGTRYVGNFCPKGCNAPTYSQPAYSQPAYSQPSPVQQVQQQAGKRCPKCGSTNLEVISDVQGKGASFWKLCFCGLLGLCGTGKTTTTHYWVCRNCGNKFKV